MFVALQAAGLTLKPSKLAFGPKSAVYLGHVISAEGISIWSKISKINQPPRASKIFVPF